MAQLKANDEHVLYVFIKSCAQEGKGPDFFLLQMLLQSQGKVEEWEDRAPPMKGKGHLTPHW